MVIKEVKTKEEAKVCEELLTKLINSEKEFNDDIKENYVVKDYLVNLYDKPSNSIFIALEKELIIGYLYIKIITSKDSPEKNNEALIDGLYVEEKFRNMGVAKKLINESKKWAKSKNVKYIKLNVLSNNDIAKSLYYKEGFKDFSLTLREEIK